MTGTTQGCCVLFSTNPKSSTLKHSSCAATYRLSHKERKICTCSKKEKKKERSEQKKRNVEKWKKEILTPGGLGKRELMVGGK